MEENELSPLINVFDKFRDFLDLSFIAEPYPAVILNEAILNESTLDYVVLE